MVYDLGFCSKMLLFSLLLLLACCCWDFPSDLSIATEWKLYAAGKVGQFSDAQII